MEEPGERNSIDDEDQRLLKLRMEALNSVKLPRKKLEDSKAEIQPIAPHTSSYRKASTKKRNKESRRNENLIILNTDGPVENFKKQDLSMEASPPKPRPSTGPARFNRWGSSDSCNSSDSELLHCNDAPKSPSKSSCDDKWDEKTTCESQPPQKDQMLESGSTKACFDNSALESPSKSFIDDKLPKKSCASHSSRKDDIFECGEMKACTDNGAPESPSKSFSDDKWAEKITCGSQSPRKNEMFESDSKKESDKCTASILCKEKMSPISKEYSCFPGVKTTDDVDEKNEDLLGCNIMLHDGSVRTSTPSHEDENKPELSDHSPYISIFVNSSLESLMYADISDPVTGPKQTSSHNNSPEHDSYESGEIRSDSSPEKYSVETYTKKDSVKSENWVNAEHLEHSKILCSSHSFKRDHSRKTLEHRLESNSSSFPSPEQYKEASNYVKEKEKGLKRYYSSDDESSSDTAKKSRHSRHRKHHKSRDNQKPKKSKKKKSKKHSKKKTKHSH